MVATLRITLVPVRDDDLIQMIKNAANGSLAGIVREAMRSGVLHQQPAESSGTDEDGFDFTGAGFDL